MRPWVCVLICLLPAVGALPGAPEATPAVALVPFSHAWGDDDAENGPSQTAGCRVTEGRYWAVAPLELENPDACVETVHSGPIRSTAITCPTTTHCSVYAETASGAYGAFQIHCFPFGQGVQPPAGPLAAAQCDLLADGADPSTWTTWTSWVSVGPGGVAPGGTAAHVFGP